MSLLLKAKFQSWPIIIKLFKMILSNAMTSQIYNLFLTSVLLNLMKHLKIIPSWNIPLNSLVKINYSPLRYSDFNLRSRLIILNCLHLMILRFLHNFSLNLTRLSLHPKYFKFFLLIRNLKINYPLILLVEALRFQLFLRTLIKITIVSMSESDNFRRRKVIITNPINLNRSANFLTRLGLAWF